MNEHDVVHDVDALSASENPYVIGVRHHSAICAVCMPRWLDAAKPTHVLVELPSDLAPWLDWLAHEDLEAPVALAGSTRDGTVVSFYPFADFSPELAALRWARRHGVVVEAIDRPLGARTAGARGKDRATFPLLDHASRATALAGVEALWDGLVEARGFGAEPDAVRRAALAFGRLVRADAEVGGGVDDEDLRREAYMRAAIARAIASGGRVAAVVGSFHAHALLSTAPLLDAETNAATSPIESSLVPYAFELLDSRSGYPAGVRDPMWQQRVYELASGREGAEVRDVDELVTRVALEASKGLRARGHASSVVDAIEVTRLARDLASLRGLTQPGRRELLESLSSAMGQGELIGRGRVLASALEQSMVGRRRGRLAVGTPRSGLTTFVERELEALGLPQPTRESVPRPVELVLDPLRNARDLARHLLLERLVALDVPYGERVVRSTFVDAESLSVRWSIVYTPQTAARLEFASVYGSTLEAAAAGRLVHERARLEQADALSIAARLGLAERAAHAALRDASRQFVRELVDACLREAGLAELLEVAELLERIRSGHVPGLEPHATNEDDVGVILDAAVAAVEGLAGSTRREDARALHDLAQLTKTTIAHAHARLGEAVRQIAVIGAPRMQGAALGACAMLGVITPEALCERLGSFVDAGVDAEARATMAERLAGLLEGGAELIESFPELASAITLRIDALDDQAFATRLPALRQGFSELSPASRQRLLDALRLRLGAALRDVATPEIDPVEEARTRALDAEIGVELAARGLLVVEASAHMSSASPTDVSQSFSRDHAIGIEDRWRLVLGREARRLSSAAGAYAHALDGLYGHGRGEGSRGGDEASLPSIREWERELESLFDVEVREEVFGTAIAEGHPSAALGLGDEPVVPSVALLERVLSLRGGLGEAHLAKIRPLIASIVRRLVDALAVRVRPALVGFVSPRTTRRPTSVVDVGATIRKNLHTARRMDVGFALSPERFVFRTRRKKALDWHIVLVVDVSGSMEPSTIHAAIMAAILSSVPALSVRFHAFSTEIVDLTDRVEDPLSLLLEVRVGGGTDIGRAIRHAREHVRVPSRTIVVVVSDFEEGAPIPVLLSEVRALVETGAHVLGLAALDEKAVPRHNVAIARSLVEAGMPIAALTPVELARYIAEKIR